MNVLVIGADEITPIKPVLKDLGASNIEHWDARNENRVNRKPIPQDTECVVMLTSFLTLLALRTPKARNLAANLKSFQAVNRACLIIMSLSRALQRARKKTAQIGI